MAQKKRKRKKKLPSIPTLKRKALRLWALKVKEVHGGRCVICGSTETLNSHHIEDKTNYALRFDLVNGICLCAGCHNFRKNSAHRSAVFFYEWLAKNRPAVIDYVREHRGDTIDFTRDRMNSIIEELSGPARPEVIELLNLSSVAPDPGVPEPPSESDSPSPPPPEDAGPSPEMTQKPSVPLW